MDGWIKWLGELVWRLSKLPADVRGDEREENFYYRLYGLLSLVGSIGVLAYGVYQQADPLSKLVADLVRYAGPDRLVVQGFAGALGLLVVFPVIICTAFILATAISVPAGVGLLGVKVIGWLSYLWAKRFKEKHEPRELTAEQREAFAVLVLGLVATFILWIAFKAGAKPLEGPPSPDQPPEPPDEKKDAHPAA
ncbi:MAG: hypothetical protein ACOY94_06015 [Bacillota bacterium]